MISPVDEIKQRLDIVEVISGYIRLTKAGRNYKANCPFHAEKTPSFFVTPERQMWHCFGCGIGGSIFDFVMQMEGLEFGDALRILARRAGVELKKIDPQLITQRTRLYDICELAARFFEKQLESSQAGLQTQKYLKERGLKASAINKWRLGYSPDKWRSLTDFLQSRGYREEEIVNCGLAIKKEDDQNIYDRFRNRIIFPIFDLSGLVIGFSGRIFDPDKKIPDTAKYINTSNTLLYDKSLVLYGLDKAKLEIKKKNLCILVEGQMDLLMAHQAGFANTIATSGTALTFQHLKIIKRYTENLAMAFDMDIAGENATKRGIDLAIQSGLNAKIISLPQSQDPADIFNSNPQVFEKAMQNSQSIIEFYFASAFSKFNAALVDGKKNIAKIILPILKRIPNKIEQAHWIVELSQKLKTSEKVLIEEMQKIPVFEEFTDSSAKKQDIYLEANPSLALAQHALAMLLVSPKEVESLKNQPSNIFIHPDLAQIFKKLKNCDFKKEFDLKKFQSKLPSHLASQIDYLMLRLETLHKEDNFNAQQEISFCLEHLKKQYVQQKLNQLNSDIKEAELKKDTASLKKLTEEFNKLSQQLTAV